MSGYWQAIERMAGEAADTATPRPRSRFEEPLGEPVGDPFSAWDEPVEADAEPAVVQDASARRVTRSENRAGEEGERSEADRQAALQNVAAAPVDASFPDRVQQPQANAQADGKPVVTDTLADPPSQAFPIVRERPSGPPAAEAAHAAVTIADERPAAAGSPPAGDVPLATPPTLFDPSPDPAPANDVEPTSAETSVLAMPLPLAMEAAGPRDERADPPAAAAGLTIEIHEIQIRLATDGLGASATVAPLRPAGRGETTSLHDFLARQSDGCR